MKSNILTKPLYTSEGSEPIIQAFIDKRFSATVKEGKVYLSKKKNKRIVEAKIYSLIHKFWVDRIHNKKTISTINRNTLADEIWSDKKYEVSLIIKFMDEDGLISKERNAYHTKGHGKSAGYSLGEVLDTPRWTTRLFLADCAVIRNMIAHGEQFAQTQGEAVLNAAQGVPVPLSRDEAFRLLDNVVSEIKDVVLSELDRDLINYYIILAIQGSSVLSAKGEALTDHVASYIAEKYPNARTYTGDSEEEFPLSEDDS